MTAPVSSGTRAGRCSFLLLLFALLVFYGCSDRQTPSFHVLKCAEGTTLSSKIDLSVFGPFSPGMRFPESRKRFGEPERVWHGDFGTTFHFYATDKAQVAVAKEVQVSGGMPKLEWWTVYAYPSARAAFPLEEVLSRDTREAIKGHPRPFQLVIRAAGAEGVWCKVATNGVTEIRWLNAQSKLPSTD